MKGALIEVLARQSQGQSLDLALSRALKAATGLNAPGRSHMVAVAHAINKHRARLNWHLAKEGVTASPDALLAVWQIFQRSGQDWRSLFAELPRETVRAIGAREINDPTMPVDVRWECPAPFHALLAAALGDDWVAEARASLEDAPTDLRVNLLKSQRNAVRKTLSNAGIEAVPTPFSPWGLRVKERAHVSASIVIGEGWADFQDEASQLCALICDAREGMQVLDLCAGTGGKSLALGSTMKNKGHLVCCDISEVRLARAKIRLKRGGVENAERKLLPPEDDKWLKRHHSRFDRVLVDAPCSGTGSWRRNPDLRWSRQAGLVEELTVLQAKILARAARFVKPGGRLIYATCSLLPQENDAVVEGFLAAHQGFSVVDGAAVWSDVTDSEWPCGNDRFLRLSPAKHGTDGFFAAVLQKATIPA